MGDPPLEFEIPRLSGKAYYALRKSGSGPKPNSAIAAYMSAFAAGPEIARGSLDFRI